MYFPRDLPKAPNYFLLMHEDKNVKALLSHCVLSNKEYKYLYCRAVCLITIPRATNLYCS